MRLIPRTVGENVQIRNYIKADIISWSIFTRENIYAHRVLYVFLKAHITKCQN